MNIEEMLELLRKLQTNRNLHKWEFPTITLFTDGSGFIDVRTAGHEEFIFSFDNPEDLKAKLIKETKEND